MAKGALKNIAISFVLVLALISSTEHLEVQYCYSKLKGTHMYIAKLMKN